MPLIDNLLGRAELGTAGRARHRRGGRGKPAVRRGDAADARRRRPAAPLEDGWVPRARPRAITIPPTIHALLTARLDRLPAGARGRRPRFRGRPRLRWGAVAELCPPEEHGRADRLPALAHPQGADAARVRETHEEDSFRFAHILIRDAAYGAMPKAPARRLHEQFADWIEAEATERAGGVRGDRGLPPRAGLPALARARAHDAADGGARATRAAVVAGRDRSARLRARRHAGGGQPALTRDQPARRRAAGAGRAAVAARVRTARDGRLRDAAGRRRRDHDDSSGLGRCRPPGTRAVARPARPYGHAPRGLGRGGCDRGDQGDRRLRGAGRRARPRRGLVAARARGRHERALRARRGGLGAGGGVRVTRRRPA